MIKCLKRPHFFGSLSCLLRQVWLYIKENISTFQSYNFLKRPLITSMCMRYYSMIFKGICSIHVFWKLNVLSKVYNTLRKLVYSLIFADTVSFPHLYEARFKWNPEAPELILAHNVWSLDCHSGYPVEIQGLSYIFKQIFVSISSSREQFFTLFYLFIYMFASDTHNLDHMYPYQLLVAVTKKKGKQC